MALVVAQSALYRLYLAIMTSRGTYPAKGHATMRDVERLIDEHRFGLAQRCYRGIIRASLKETVAAVARMRQERAK